MGLKLIELFDQDGVFRVYRGRDAVHYTMSGTTERKALEAVRDIIERDRPACLTVIVDDPDGTRPEEV